MSSTYEDVSAAIEVLTKANKKLSHRELCKFSDHQMNKYKELLRELKSVNSSSATNEEKGAALEELSSYLLKVSGNLFDSHKNIRTSTNEIDHIFNLTPVGKALSEVGVVDKRFEQFIGESKNYNKKVNVTYLGKFCSLLITNNIKLGILFSYHGVSGKKWGGGAGLIKKFYLHKENPDERYVIIDFGIKEFEMIANKSSNFLDIVEKKISALKFDTSFRKFLKSHPAENK